MIEKFINKNVLEEVQAKMKKVNEYTCLILCSHLKLCVGL